MEGFKDSCNSARLFAVPFKPRCFSGLPGSAVGLLVLATGPHVLFPRLRFSVWPCDPRWITTASQAPLRSTAADGARSTLSITTFLHHNSLRLIEPVTTLRQRSTIQMAPRGRVRMRMRHARLLGTTVARIMPPGGQNR